jgi:uncharacterized protein (TIGR02118 family)
MTKILSLVQAAPGLEGRAFADYWRDRYLAALLAIPAVRSSLRRVVHNQAQPSSIRDDAEAAPAGWAGVSEMWFTDREAARAFLANADVAAVAREHAGSLPQIVHLHVREVLMWDHGGKHDALKAMAFFLPNPAMTREQAQRYWNVDHVAEGARLGMGQKLSKYVQNHTLLDHHASDPRYDFAGGPELWFNSLEDAETLFSDEDKVAQLSADEAKFSDRSTTAMMVVDEVVVFRSEMLTET